MCDKAVDDSLGALKLIPDWFVTSKTIKKLFTSLYVDKNILYFNEDSGNVKFSCNEMGILNIEILIIILIIILLKLILIHIRLLAWHIKFGNAKNLKKISEELLLTALHPKRWWNFCISEDEKKDIEPILLSDDFNVYNMEALGHFGT